MPALPVVPGVIRWEFLWTQSGVPCANIFHSSYTGGPPSSEDLQSLGNTLAHAFWVSGLYEGYPTTTVLVGVRGTDLATDTGAVGEYSDGRAGTYAGGELPAQACVLANYVQARRYRGGHPRAYLLPPNQTLLATPSEWGADIITEMNGCLVALQTAMGDSTAGSTDLSGQVCVSYVTAGAPRVDPLVEPLTGVTVSPILATQRRRIRASSY